MVAVLYPAGVPSVRQNRFTAVRSIRIGPTAMMGNVKKKSRLWLLFSQSVYTPNADTARNQNYLNPMNFYHSPQSAQRKTFFALRGFRVLVWLNFLVFMTALLE